MKISIIYHSESGNTQKVADLIAKGASSLGGVEVRSMSINDVDMTFLDESSAVIIGCPAYGGSFSHQLKDWLDKVSRKQLEGKLGAVFATENYLGGGSEMALMGIIAHLLVSGMLVYSGGASLGHPYIHFGAICIRNGDEFQQQRAVIFGERVAKKANQLFGSNK